MSKASDNVFPRFLVSEGGSTATPAAGRVTIYAKADGLLYQKDDAGTETLLANGASGAVATDAIWDAAGDLVQGTGANTAARLALGTAGQVLKVNAGATAAEWGAASGGSGALVLLEQYTASASATLDFTTFISSTYDDYMFELLNVMPATTNTNLLMRMGTGAGPTWDSGTNYAWAGWRWAPAGSATAGASTGLSSIGLDCSGGIKSDAVLPFSGSFRLFAPQHTTAYKRVTGQAGYVDNTGTIIGSTLSGLYLSATAVTGVRFLMASGNITSGIIRAYGITK